MRTDGIYEPALECTENLLRKSKKKKNLKRNNETETKMTKIVILIIEAYLIT